MEIAVRYPELTAEEYVSSINTFNKDIEKKNHALKLLVPRIIAGFFVFIGIAAFLVLFSRTFYHVTEWVTARDELVIIFSILAYFFLFIFGIVLVFNIVKKERHRIVALLGGQEYEEKYSASKYVDRSDPDKKIGGYISYYKKCDILRESEIIDAAIVCGENTCKVDIKYRFNGTDELCSFTFPYRYTDAVSVNTIDFERKWVLLAKNGGTAK